MPVALDTTGWGNFFVAEVGASAALVGLLFVAVSINLARIIAVPTLPARAFEALAVLVMVLLVASLALVPDQSAMRLGSEVLAVALGTWFITVFLQRRSPKDPSAPRGWMLSRVVPTQFATLPMIVAGASILVGRRGGLHWTVLGVVGSFLAALIEAWVLLIEIHR
jgi:hypothetical protein